ncbi:hypothetical protein [Enhygromyxa salina]|nr:hypothetical protein [Enhygromyxa salina]
MGLLELRIGVEVVAQLDLPDPGLEPGRERLDEALDVEHRPCTASAAQ